jgi:hypothetical protein
MILAVVAEVGDRKRKIDQMGLELSQRAVLFCSIGGSFFLPAFGLDPKAIRLRAAKIF